MVLAKDVRKRMAWRRRGMVWLLLLGVLCPVERKRSGATASGGELWRRRAVTSSLRSMLLDSVQKQVPAGLVQKPVLALSQN